MNKIIKYLFALIILGSMLIGLFVGWRRLQFELRDKEVELVMDFYDIQTLAKMDGLHPSYLLLKLKENGIRSIALAEETLEGARERGILTWVSGYEILDNFRLSYSISPMFKGLLKRNDINPRSFYIAFTDVSTLKRVKDELRLTLGVSQVKKIGTILEVKDTREELELLGIGINPRIYSMLKREGFKVVPRLKNSFRLTPKNISRKLNMQGIVYEDDLAIFDEEEVLGYPNYLQTVATEFKKRGINFGYVEFSKQKGDAALAKLMQDCVIRVHSITPEEMEIISYREAMGRWMRACRERGIRVLYIHPFLKSFPGLSLTETNLKYINDLKKNLMESGFAFGRAKLKKGLVVKPTEVLLLSLGVIGAALLLCGYFVNLPHFIWIFIFIILFSLGFFLPYRGLILTYRKILAVASAIIFPALAVISSITGGPEEKFISFKALKILFKVVGISLIGAVFIIGFLSDSAFMSGAEVFQGVKLSLLLPVIIIAAYFIFCKASEEAPMKKIFSLFNLRITVMHLFLFVVFLLFFLIFILRSGNFGLPVLSLEITARDILQKVLLVRPRMKELVFYPVLFLAIIYYLRGGKNWLWIWFPVGSIALVSLVNTFCHIHSPIIISLLRSLYGIAFGIILGVVLYGLYNLWKRIEVKSK